MTVTLIYDRYKAIDLIEESLGFLEYFILFISNIMSSQEPSESEEYNILLFIRFSEKTIINFLYTIFIMEVQVL
jgi:hypothetical protein